MFLFAFTSFFFSKRNNETYQCSKVQIRIPLRDWTKNKVQRKRQTLFISRRARDSLARLDDATKRAPVYGLTWTLVDGSPITPLAGKRTRERIPGSVKQAFYEWHVRGESRNIHSRRPRLCGIDTPGPL